MRTTPKPDHDRVMRMVAAIIERGDDDLSDQWSGSPITDAKWVIDILLGQLGYKLHVTEDGEVQIWPEDPTSMEPGDRPYEADGYREAWIDGKWYHSNAEYRAAVAKHNALASAMDTLDRMAQKPTTVDGIARSFNQDMVDRDVATIEASLQEVMERQEEQRRHDEQQATLQFADGSGTLSATVRPVYTNVELEHDNWSQDQAAMQLVEDWDRRNQQP